MKKIQTLFISLFIACMAFNAFAADDEFVPAYQNEGSYELDDPSKYFAYEEGRTYYTSGKENGFRVNENNEKSTDETIGILTLLLAPATIIYMNLVGWWE
jgi:hypothetical protein|tara:strand:+ start:498 stop:797 length:300 start_codon:yes stop_codon:yes gene_type:complete